MAGKPTSNPDPVDPQRPKVLYVLGAGRSGSTILGVALGNCENVFYAGELDKWLFRSGKPGHSDAPRTEFWSDVRGRVDVAERLFSREAHKYLERSSSLFRLRGWYRRRQIRTSYRSAMRQLYLAVAAVARSDRIVDSSHYPLRARELQSVPGIDLHLLFLVRDPQSVVASFARDDVREPRFNVLTTNAYLWLTYLLCTYVFLKHPSDRRLLVRHEDFLAAPEQVLRRILDQSGPSSSLPKDLSALETGLPLQGNRLIDASTVGLKRGRPQVRRSSWLTWMLQAPWSFVFARLRPDAGRG